MDDPSHTIAAVAFLSLLGAVYAAASAGISALGEAHLHAIAEENDKRGDTARRVLARLPVLQTRLIVGRFLCVVLVTALALQAAGSWEIAPVLTWLVPALLAYSLSVELASALVRRKASSLALVVVRYARPLELVAAPFALPAISVRWLAERWIASARESDPAHIAALAVEHLIDEGEEQGSIDEQHAEMLRSLLDFRDTVAREVMVPRPRVVAFTVATETVDVLRGVVDSGHSRYPVYGKSVDQVEGILYAKDLFHALQQLGEPGAVDISRLIRRPVFFVAEDALIVEVLREMQVRRSHLAIVKDEFGATAGIITLEDILEEIVGEIQDEYDDDEDLARVSEVTPGEYAVDGAYLVDDLEGSLDAEIRDGRSSDTVGGLVTEIAGRVPAPGEVFHAGDYALTVLSVEGGRVTHVRVSPRELAAGATSDAATG